MFSRESLQHSKALKTPDKPVLVEILQLSYYVGYRGGPGNSPKTGFSTIVLQTKFSVVVESVDSMLRNAPLGKVKTVKTSKHSYISKTRAKWNLIGASIHIPIRFMTSLNAPRFLDIKAAEYFKFVKGRIWGKLGSNENTFLDFSVNQLIGNG